ncbi:unnamed protein product [Cylicostephanus goldi]|uniref:Uncharacterized protein n=1 Tax=Cylicostephanus goldi TaxID=71465 RepID=A0A3P6R8M5_CYLGO|nr:unnamed protein product [Cylicostephanus goldi]
MTDHSAVTPSSKMMPALTPVGSAESKTSNSGKQSRKRKSSKTPTASKSRRSNVQKKSPETDMRCGTKKTSPPKGANPEATPKIVLSVNLNASNNSTNSRKRKPSRTPRTASKSRITTQKKSPKASRARSTEAALSSKRPKAQATPKIVMSADSSASSTGNGSRSRKKDLSQSQLTPFTSRLRTNRAQRQPFSSASTPSTTKKRTRGKCQTPHAAATIASPKNESNSFETPKIVESQMSLVPGSKSKKRTSKTPKNVDSQPRANSSSKKREEKVAKTCLMTSASNANISAEQETSFLTKCSPEIPLHGNIEGSEKKLMPKSAKVAAKAQRKLRSRRKAFTPGVQKLSKKSKRSETISKTKNVKGKRKSSTKNYVILEDAVDQSNKIGNAEDAAPPVHKNSPVPLSSQKWSTSTKLGKRRSDDSDFERVVTPLIGEAAAFDFWNGNVSSVVESYDNNFMCFGKPTTILGFDAGDVRRSCGEDAQQSTLSAFLNCARKYSLSEAESVSVDGAMKEDRRAMAAARNRNRQLISGYYV